MDELPGISTSEIFAVVFEFALPVHTTAPLAEIESNLLDDPVHVVRTVVTIILSGHVLLHVWPSKSMFPVPPTDMPAVEIERQFNMTVS